jgi:hypothetical protein
VADDVSGCVDDGFAGGERAPQGAGILTDAGPKDFAAGFAQRFLPINAGDALGRLIESGNSPVEIDREYPFVDRVEDHIRWLGGLRHGHY